MKFETKAKIATQGGWLLKLSHEAETVKCPMDVNVFFPGPVDSTQKYPVLLYLSGLTCTPNNCSEKGFIHYWAAKHGIAVVLPDTSPRGTNIPGEHESWDFGSGAGFYINATQEPWKSHYNMYSYITEELPCQLFSSFPSLDGDRVSLTGHSMGGHGALTLFLKNPGKYKSVSAFAPICNPVKAPWGQKAFKGYFGEHNQALWASHDATELIKNYSGPTPEILIDVGSGDNFYNQKQLLPENLVEASKGTIFENKIQLNIRKDYDHSYYFVSSFAHDHVQHHAKYLK